MTVMKFIRNFCLMAILLAVGLTAWHQPTPAEQKMMLSWDFSQGSGDFYTQEYTTYGSQFTLESEGGLANSACARIDSESENDARFVLNLDVLPDTYYRISAWVRTEGVPADDGVGGNLSILNTRHYEGNLQGDQDWTQVTLYGFTGEDQTALSVCLRLGFYGGVTSGTVWFDNVEIEQLSARPAGVPVVAFQDTMSNQSYQEENTYWDAMKIGGLLMVAVALIFAVMYRYGTLRDRQLLGPTKGGLSLPACIFLMITLGLILRLILSVTAPQCSIDVGLFKYWGQMCVRDGISDFYTNAQAYSLDYPPLYIYFLWFNTVLAKGLGIVSTAGYTLLIKLPSILADCGIAFLLYRLCDRRMRKNWVILIVAAWLFNPMVILDSAAWGQVDSLLTLFLCLMLYFIVRKRMVLAAVFLGLAIILKPQGIFLIPILGFAWLQNFIRDRETGKLRQIGQMFACIGACAGTIVAVALPFGIRQKPHFFSWIVNLYIGTANGYKGATVNAYNFYYLLGENWTGDDTPWLFGLTFFQWGMLLIVVICLLIGALYLFGKMKPGTPFLLAATLVYAVTMFGPRMHERYFFPCLAFLLIAAVYANNKMMLWLYGGISAVNFLSVFSIMMGLEVGNQLKEAGASQAVYGWYYWAGDAVHRDCIAGGNLFLCLTLVTVTVIYAFRRQAIFPKGDEIWQLEEDLYEEISLFV